MATIKRFEDLEVWQIARNLCRFVYRITSKGKFAKDFALKNQIRNSSDYRGKNLNNHNI
ncbi:MAG: four helix bundle protein [Bacteroidales bacterium]|nr:four helix bundle protein [Bacteroidales bacterium]